MGTHGSVIVLLAVKNAKTPYKPKGKLTKHSSAITCLDWSEDGKNLQSVDMGYELLFWSVDETKHKNSKHVPHAKSLKDVKWATQSCKFGWPVDGTIDCFLSYICFVCVKLYFLVRHIYSQK